MFSICFLLLFVCKFLKSWQVMQCSYLLYSHYTPILAFIYHLSDNFNAIFISVIFCQCLSKIMFRYCSKLDTILPPHFLFMPKFFLPHYCPRKELNIYTLLLYSLFDSIINNRISLFLHHD